MAISSKRVLTEGLIAGAIGYFTSALFFAIACAAQGKSVFHTPAVLGSILFYGVHDVSGLTVSAGPVIAFNGAYLVLYLIVGLALGLLAAEAEQGPHLLFLGALLGIGVLIHLVGGSIVFSTLIGSAVTIWEIVIAGLLGATAMVTFLYRLHPALRKELESEVEVEFERS